jgi:hypothetical protein
MTTTHEAPTPYPKDGSLAKPTPLPVNVENIPEELRRHDCWVCWRYELDKGKWKKPPIDSHTGRKADKTDPRVLAPFEKALAYYQAHDDLDGVGFVFTPEGPFSGVDLDKCRNPQTGHFHPQAEDIIRSLHSYGEVSPSGTGAKLFVRGKLPPDSYKRTTNTGWGSLIEMYSSASYFTVTGLHLPGTPATVEERGEALLGLYQRLFGEEAPETSHTPVMAPDTGLSDDDIIELVKIAKLPLWKGNIQGYDSASEADMALCGTLAYHTRGDAARIEALFSRSALAGRKKWRTREDYRKRTIEKAIRGLKTLPSAKAMSVELVPADDPAVRKALALAERSEREGWEPWRSPFELARHLLLLGGNPGRLRPAVDAFADRMGFDPEECWGRFLLGWGKVRHPDSIFEEAVRLADEKPIVVSDDYSDNYRRLASIAYYLGQLTEGRVFFLPQPKLAGVLGLSQPAVSVIINLLRMHGCLQAVNEKYTFGHGKKNRAKTYRWTG